MSEFSYTTANSDSILCTGFRNHSDWRTGRSTAAAYQGYYRKSPDGGYDDNRIGVVHIPGLSGLKGTRINSISISVKVGSSGVHSWATKNLIFRKSHINGGTINTGYTGCQYAFGAASPSSTNADTYKTEIVDCVEDGNENYYNYDSDILGIIRGGLADNTTTISLSGSSNSTFFSKMKEYIEAGNDTFVFYNADTSRIYNKNSDGVNDGTVYYSYEFLNVTGLTITVNYSKLYTVTFNAGDGNLGKDSSGNVIKTKAYNKYEGDSLSLSDVSALAARGRITTSFKINGTTGLDENISQTASKYQNFTLDSWNSKSDGSGTYYATNGEYSSDASTTLYAIFDHNFTYSNNVISGSDKYPWWSITKDPILNATYTITFNGNGGTCTVSALNADKITTYVLDGWYSGQNGTGTKYNSNSSFTSQTNLYANWTGTTTTESINLPASNTVTRKGYDFINWNTAASGAGSAYAAGSAYIPTSSLTLYASYEAKGLIRIYTAAGVYREALVWVFDGSKWIQAIPHVYDGTQWKIGG